MKVSRGDFSGGEGDGEQYKQSCADMWLFNKIYTQNWWQKSSILAVTQVVIITFK